VRLPKDELDGALSRDRVIMVLKKNGVGVQEEDDGVYLLEKTGIYDVQLFPTQITRKVIQYLARKFEIATIDFYYPNRKLN